MKEYLKAQGKTNEIIVGSSISSDELDRFSKSDFRWADNRKKAFRQRPVKKERFTSLNSAKTISRRCHMSIAGLLNDITKICAMHKNKEQHYGN